MTTFHTNSCWTAPVFVSGHRSQNRFRGVFLWDNISQFLPRSLSILWDQVSFTRTLLFYFRKITRLLCFGNIWQWRGNNWCSFLSPGKDKILALYNVYFTFCVSFTVRFIVHSVRSGEIWTRQLMTLLGVEEGSVLFSSANRSPKTPLGCFS